MAPVRSGGGLLRRLAGGPGRRSWLAAGASFVLPATVLYLRAG